jgi:NitT/TauT family transport system substrate-binding protein
VVKGADVVVISSFVNKMPYKFMTGAHIKTPDDLKGKKIAVATFGGAAYVASHMVLKQFGLDPKRDQIGLIQMGTEPERLAAMLSGHIDAAMMAPEIAARLSTPPYRVMLDLRTANIPWQHTSMITTRSFIKANPQLVEGALRALVEGFAFTFDPKNKEAVKRIIGKNMKTEKPEELEEGYRDALDHLAWKPIPSLEGGATVLRMMAELEIVKEASRLKPLDIMDPSIMEKLDKEGFLDRVKH